MSRVSAISKADVHLHTTASDGVFAVEQLLAHVAATTDLSVIAITDHDTLDGALRGRDLSQRRGYRVDVVVGEEVSSADGHIVGLWLELPVAPGMTAADTVAAIHEQGGIAFAAHPFYQPRRLSRSIDPTAQGVGGLIRTVAFDAVEGINGTPCLQVANLRARRFNRRYCQLPEVGGSDAHILGAVGKSFTLFPGRTAADLRSAIELGRVTAAHSWYRPVDLITYAAFWVRATRSRKALTRHQRRLARTSAR